MDELSKKFNLAPIGSDQKVLMKPDDSATGDHQYVRENLYRSIEIGQDALTDLAELAKSSQQARTYEVLATLLARVTEANEKYYNLHKSRKELESSDQGPQTVNHNQTLVLTTAALSEMIEKKTKDILDQNSPPKDS